MADLVINEEFVTVTLSAVERIEAMHANLSVPRSAVLRAWVAPDGMDQVHGVRAPGTALPGVVMVGTWRSPAGTTFAACHGHRPAVIIDLIGQPYDRLVVTVDHPQEAIEGLPHEVAG